MGQIVQIKVQIKLAQNKYILLFLSVFTTDLHSTE